ncbi:Protein unc-93 A [Mactra antiquata]
MTQYGTQNYGFEKDNYAQIDEAKSGQQMESSSPPPYNTVVKQENPQAPMSTLRILKNIGVVSFGFLCLFTSFQSLSNLQSSLNREDGLGVGGLAVLYGALVISCMFVPPVFIARVGCKWTVVFSMMCYILYMVANFYAVWGTIVPSAIILGLGAAPLWSAKCTYLTETGVWYARLTGKTEDDVINRFFGFFFMLFQTGQIWGNLLSSMIFQKEDSNITDADLLTCGAKFCPSADVNNSNLDKPDMDKIYTLCGIYVGFAVLAVLVVIALLDPITLEREEGQQRQFSFHLVLETFRHLVNSRYQVMLVVLTMYSGIEQAFIAGDYTQLLLSILVYRSRSSFGIHILIMWYCFMCLLPYGVWVMQSYKHK